VVSLLVQGNHSEGVSKVFNPPNLFIHTTPVCWNWFWLDFGNTNGKSTDNTNTISQQGQRQALNIHQNVLPDSYCQYILSHSDSLGSLNLDIHHHLQSSDEAFPAGQRSSSTKRG